MLGGPEERPHPQCVRPLLPCCVFVELEFIKASCGQKEPPVSFKWNTLCNYDSAVFPRVHVSLWESVPSALSVIRMLWQEVRWTRAVQTHPDSF